LIALLVLMTLESIGEPFVFQAMVIAAAIVMAFPIIIIVRSWRLLSWSGKGFF
jgi:hypothetical protein